jgi:hypothetical protein
MHEKMSIANRSYTREDLQRRTDCVKHNEIQGHVIEIVSEVLSAADNNNRSVTTYLPSGSGTFVYFSGHRCRYEVSSEDVLTRLRSIFPDCDIAVLEPTVLDPDVRTHRQVRIHWN